MNKTRKTFTRSLCSILMLAFVLCGMLAATRTTAEAFFMYDQTGLTSADGLFSYNLKDNEAYVHYLGNEKDVVIPAVVDGYKVNTLLSVTKAYVEKVTVSNGIKNIDSYAFYRAVNLKTVVLGDSIESIGYECFYECKNLSSINVPKNIKLISYRAFFGCKGLKNTDIYKKIIAVDDHAFGCNYENEVCKICGESAFGYWIYNGRAGIDYYFGESENVVVPETVEGYPVSELAFWQKDNGHYPWYSGMKTITVPRSVTLIYGYDGWPKEYSYTADIIGYSGTYAEQFAKEAGVKFIPLDGVTYRTHVQSYGWQDWVRNGEMSGTSGQAKRLEGIEIKLDGQPVSGSIEYRTHVQSYGWQGWKKDGAMSGTSGEAKRLEAIEIRLTGEMAKKYDIYYRVHAQSYGWLGWAKNGESAGTASLAKRLEGIEIKLVEKGKAAPGSTENAFINGENANIQYRTHVQSYGWQGWKKDGAMSGTSGEAKRLEGIEIKVDSPLAGSIEYRTHVQTYGWQGWKKDGAMSGTSGEAKRLEAIQIRLTGDLANKFDIYYRVHAQKYGWLGWVKNGASSGTEGLGYRLEGIQIVLVKKGAAAPKDDYLGIKMNVESGFVKAPNYNFPSLNSVGITGRSDAFNAKVDAEIMRMYKFYEGYNIFFDEFSDLDKIFLVNQYIYYNFSYGLGSVNAESLIDKRYATCYGFADFEYCVLRKLGFSQTYKSVGGKPVPHQNKEGAYVFYGVDHMLTLVKLNNKWYETDGNGALYGEMFWEPEEITESYANYLRGLSNTYTKILP